MEEWTGNRQVCVTVRIAWKLNGKGSRENWMQFTQGVQSFDAQSANNAEPE